MKKRILIKLKWCVDTLEQQSQISKKMHYSDDVEIMYHRKRVVERIRSLGCCDARGLSKLT